MGLRYFDRSALDVRRDVTIAFIIVCMYVGIGANSRQVVAFDRDLCGHYFCHFSILNLLQQPLFFVRLFEDASKIPNSNWPFVYPELTW